MSAEDLALNGGIPVRTASLPTSGDASGRDIGDEELANLTQVVRSGKLFRHGGTFVERFERDFAAMHQAAHAVACTSGTASIHLAVAAVNPEPGDEIITSPITDMGSVAPILMQNAVPIFADLDPETYTLDPESVKQKISDRTRAIIPVHLFGNPTDMYAILEIASEHALVVIEDCCQAYLAEHNGRLVGTMGDMGCFSLQQSKHITAGDGGITITNRDDLAERASLFADKGWPRTGEVRDYLFLGINYRMNELSGAVACAQLGKVEKAIVGRRRVASLLTGRLRSVPEVLPPVVRDGCKHSYWYYPITLRGDALRATPRDFASALSAEGIPASAGYIGRPIYMSPALKEKRTYGRSHCPYDCPAYGKPLEYKEHDCPNTLDILQRLILLPCNEMFTDEDVDDMAQAIAKVVGYYRA